MKRKNNGGIETHFILARRKSVRLLVCWAVSRLRSIDLLIRALCESESVKMARNSGFREEAEKFYFSVLTMNCIIWDIIRWSLQ